jgi:drug/metabolite transporter (DMT)-like permease
VIAGTWDQLIRLNFGGLGDLLALTATLAWATTAIAARKYVREMKPGVITLYRFSIASLFFSIFLLGTGDFRIANFYQPLLGGLVGVGYILYYEGITRIKAAQVSALELCAPVFAAFLGVLFLRESVTVLQGIGIVLLFPGIYFLSRREHDSSSF